MARINAAQDIADIEEQIPQTDIMTSADLYNRLSMPFPSVEWRVGPTNAKKNGGKATKGQPLCYIDARDVMDRLDAVCGLDGWQCNYSAAGQGSIVCNLGVRMPDGQWVWKADGAGATDMEADKGMLSDALKRAAVRFGVARYLYDIKAKWVDLDDYGQISDLARKELDALHEQIANQVGWGDRPGIQVYRLMRKTVLQFVTDAVSAQEFKDKNKAEIALLPVAMQRHLFDLLGRVGAQQEAA